MVKALDYMVISVSKEKNEGNYSKKWVRNMSKKQWCDSFRPRTVVLVCLGCHNRNHRLGGLNDRHLFSHNSGGYSPRSKCQQDSFLVRPLPVLQTPALFLCPHKAFPVLKHSDVSFSSKDNSPFGSGPHPGNLIET